MTEPASVARQIAFAEARSGLDYTKPLVDRLRAAMENTKDHWMCTDEDGRFLAACLAAVDGGTEEDRERVLSEIENIRKFSAFIAAAEAGLKIDADSLPKVEDQKEPIGLMKLWREVKGVS